MHKIKILSFDPGLMIAGWSLLQTTPNTNICDVVKFGTLQAKRIATKVNLKAEVEKFGSRLITLNVLRVMVEELLNKYRPDYVVIEEAFWNRARPSAHAALVQWIVTVRMLALTEYRIPTYTVAPKSAKCTLSGSGSADKANMQKAVLEHELIKFPQKAQTATMESHEADAIAVGFHFILRMLPSLSQNQPK